MDYQHYQQRVEVYIDAIGRWGKSSQVLMLAEECVELAHAAHKLVRSGEYEHGLARQALLEEIADVKAMIEQVQLICDIRTEDIDRIMARKIERLKKKLDR